ncbi:hypothetical protein [Woodsholea maritima]|uniref:hypothetical protein n=1 Tax=Woodsholea maritima TaxID=240237 RepID=UPI000376CB05|nr:hypothetical protein [Woodsholea maritima]
MPMLPTAHASLKFGHKQLDFYAAPGQVVGSDPRARADERRIQDIEGARHVVRLDPEQKLDLGAGDQVAVLRLQPGPAKRSRPVAVAHYDQQKWARTQPATAAILSRAGVARNVNWALSMFALFAAALLFVWPSLHGLASEFLPRGTMNGISAFDIFAFAVAAMPELATFGQSLASIPFLERLTTLVPQLAGQEMTIVASAIWLIGTLICFSARSWRLLWIPSFIGLIGLGGLALGGVEAPQIPALIGLGATALFFAIGGLINRVRDGMRLEARIARLSDHLLQHPVEELVQTPIDRVAPVAPHSAPEDQPAQAPQNDDDLPNDDLPSDDLPSVEETLKHTDQGRVAARTEDPDNARAITLPPPPPMAALNSDNDDAQSAIEAHDETPSHEDERQAEREARHEMTVGAETLDGEAHDDTHLNVDGDEDALVVTEHDDHEHTEDTSDEAPVVAAGALTRETEEEITLAIIEIEQSPRLNADDEAGDNAITASDESAADRDAQEAAKTPAAHAVDAHEDEAPALTPVGATPAQPQFNSDEDVSVEAIIAAAPEVADEGDDAQADAELPVRAQAQDDALAGDQDEPADLTEGDQGDHAVIAAETQDDASDQSEDEAQTQAPQAVGDAHQTAQTGPALESADNEDAPQLLNEGSHDGDAILAALEEADGTDEANQDEELEDEAREDRAEAQPAKAQNADSVSHNDENEPAHHAHLSHDDDAHDAAAISEEPAGEADETDASTVDGDDDLPPKILRQGEVEAPSDSLESDDADAPELQAETPKKVRRGFPANVIPFLRPSVAKPPMPKAPKS